MEQESTAQKSTELNNAEQGGTVRKGMSQTGAVQKNAIQSGTVQNSTPGKSGKSTGKTMKRKGKRRKTKRKKSTRKFEFTVRLDTKSFFAGIASGVLLALLVMAVLSRCSPEEEVNSGLDVDASKPEISVQLLDVNDYSRPGTEADPITGVVMHYTANPGSTAQQNRDYFNSLQDGHGTSVSSHFVIGLEGEIVQCVPTWEIAYASNGRNHDTISIECCHPDETGKFNEATYRSMVQLTAFLCKENDLDADAVIRHYDVTEKNCPKYFVENEDAWNLFRADVKAALKKEKGKGEKREQDE